MNFQEFNIHWPLKSIKNNILQVKFSLAFQTNSLALEKYCFQNYKKVLHKYQGFDINDLRMLNIMKVYIKKHIGNTEKENILEFLFTKNLFLPIIKSQGCASIIIENYDAKIFENTSIGPWPFILIEGYILFDIVKMLGLYINNDYIKIIKRDNKFVKEVIEFSITKPFPAIIVQDYSPTVLDIILSLFTVMCNTKNNFTNKLERELKIKDFYLFKKDITWQGNNSIRIVIDDWKRLLKLQTKKNWAPLTLAGIYATDKLIKKNKKIEALQQSINIYSKMIDIAEKDFEE